MAEKKAADLPAGLPDRPVRDAPTGPSASAPSPASMPAPSIPNLLARLGPPRNGRGGRRVRGGPRGGGDGLGLGHSHGPGHGQHRGGYGGPAGPTTHDAIIQSTDTDAALSRLSAVDLGLLDDPFAQFFVSDGGPSAPRLPIINRGTYARTTALDTIIYAFLSGTATDGPPGTTAPPRQIVSLGAGTDTRSFRLWSRGRPPLTDVLYHEVDFPAVCLRKRTILQSVPALRGLLASPPADVPGTPPLEDVCWSADLGQGSTLWGHGLDLRQLAAAAANKDEPSLSPSLAGLRHDVPTLVVSECCLCYLPVSDAAAVLRWFADRIPQLGVVLYEPIRPSDAFGRTMVANLSARGIDMPTLAAYEDGAAQEQRLRQQAGLEQASHATVDRIWADWVAADEKARINELNALDEEEEWQLLASHYVIAWGSRGPWFRSSWGRLYDL